MKHASAALGSLAATLLFLAGCGGTSDGPSAISVTVQGQYEKRVLSSAGFSPTLSTLPTRYAYAQVVNSASGRVEAAGTLGADGTRTFAVPKGITFFVAIYASTEVPASGAGSGFYFYGGVKKALPAATYASAEAFNLIPTWYTTSADSAANSSGNLTLRALETTGEAGAFAIADQITTFALGMRSLEPTLQLPELYAFWNPGTTSTTYPSVALATGGSAILKQGAALGGRAIFQHEVRYAGPTAADRGADAYNDGVLLEACARLLFADDSFAYANGTFGQIVRRDNDNGFVAPGDASEPAIAFVGGFSSFLSSAFRNDPTTYEVPAGGGLPTVFRLDQHTGFSPTGGGEFYPGSVARTLWGIWKNGAVFNGSPAGLGTLWSATIPTTASQGYEYGNTPLACYPTYLTGLRRLAGGAASSAILDELALENVGDGTDPTSGLYLNSTTLWRLPAMPFVDSGSFPTYAAGWSFDRNQAQAFRFSHVGGARTLTLSTSGLGLVLELFDSVGLVRLTTASSSGNGVINLPTLPAGTYVVRVRVDPYVTYPNGTINYNLSVN
ncbi:MAG: T9SS type A sorting domain-containing protein [Holophagaceae bacterium]|nr:T9SS type A sorting domain-containing protein [Holophagaceae bacterium]